MERHAKSLKYFFLSISLWTVCGHIGIGVTKIISCVFTFVLKHKNSIPRYNIIQDPVTVGPEISRVTVLTLKYPDMSVPLCPRAF